jgi:hypothetical protein
MRKFNAPNSPEHSRTVSTFSAGSSVISPARDPFATPTPSVYGAASGIQYSEGGAKYFRSRRIRKDNGHVPQTFKKDPKEKFLWIIPLMGVTIGLAITGVMIYLKIGRLTSHTYCAVLDDDFSSGTLNPSIWTKENEVGGYG